MGLYGSQHYYWCSVTQAKPWTPSKIGQPDLKFLLKQEPHEEIKLEKI